MVENRISYSELETRAFNQKAVPSTIIEPINLSQIKKALLLEKMEKFVSKLKDNKELEKEFTLIMASYVEILKFKE